jgi:hypothetical protein
MPGKITIIQYDTIDKLKNPQKDWIDKTPKETYHKIDIHGSKKFQHNVKKMIAEAVVMGPLNE